MGRHSFLQGIFPTQRFNLGLSHCRQILYHMSHEGGPQRMEKNWEKWTLQIFCKVLYLLLLLFSHWVQSVQFFCNPMDCSPPGSPVHGILQARILEWVAISSSRGSSWPRDRTLISLSPALAGGFFLEALWDSGVTLKAQLLSGVRLCDPVGCSLPARLSGKNTGVVCHFLSKILNPISSLRTI